MKVTKSDGTVVENTYDVDGVLVRTSVNGVATDLLVDTSGGLSHVVAEIDGTGTVTALYVRAGDMLLEESRGGVAKMYEADGLGSTRSLLDATGAQTDTWSYEAFGTTLSSTGGDENPYRFAGERFVGEVGMYQNRARWLDTRVGRFVSVDPIVDATGSPYNYAVQNPITLTDATGESPTLAGILVGIVVYFALEGTVAEHEGTLSKPRIQQSEVSIGIEANGGKKAYSGGMHHPSVDFGHAYIRAVDTDGSVYIFSFGPAVPPLLTLASDPATASVPGRADWPLKDDSAVEYLFAASGAPFLKGVKMMKERYKSPGPFSILRNCAFETVDIASRGFGLKVPDGRGPIKLPILDPYTNIPNPYKLNEQLEKAGHPSRKIQGGELARRNAEMDNMRRLP